LQVADLHDGAGMTSQQRRIADAMLSLLLVAAAAGFCEFSLT